MFLNSFSNNKLKISRIKIKFLLENRRRKNDSRIIRVILFRFGLTNKIYIPML